MSDKICDHCGGARTLFRDPYGNAMPCSRCRGRGYDPIDIFTAEQKSKFRAQDALYAETMRTP